MSGFFKDCLEWHVETYCQNNRDMVVAAIIHYDVAAPHMQVYSVPIIKRNDKYALSAHSIIGNRKAYINRVDDFYKKVSVKHGLERGEKPPEGQAAKKHIEIQEYKLEKIKQELKHAEEEKRRAYDEIAELEKQIAEKEQKLHEEGNYEGITRYSIFAPDQSYTDEFLKKIREEDLVVYDGSACHAVRIIPRGNMNPIFEILSEDDGHLFSASFPCAFDMEWTDGLVKQLEDAKLYWNEIKEDYFERFRNSLAKVHRLC